MTNRPKRQQGGRAGTIAVVLLVALTSLSGCGGGMSFTAGAKSMSPTVEPGDEVKVDDGSNDPSVGDLVLYKPPSDYAGGCAERLEGRLGVCAGISSEPSTDTQLLHRVVGGPGDTVEMSAGVITTNGQVESGYETRPCGESKRTSICDFPPITVPDAAFFVLGDNRGSSLDSRVFGFVKQDWIVGTAEVDG